MHIRKVPTPEEFNRIVESIWKEQSTPAQRRNVHPNLAMNYIRARYREVFKKKFPYRFHIGSGNRRTWAEYGTFTVNPDQGWHDINHDMSHWMERRLTGEAHSNQQLRFERDGAALICRRFLRDEPYVEPKEDSRCTGAACSQSGRQHQALGGKAEASGERTKEAEGEETLLRQGVSRTGLLASPFFFLYSRRGQLWSTV